MARKPRWSNKKINDGIMEVELSSWKWFYDYVHGEMLDYKHYIWRGQRCAKWALQSSFDRFVKSRHQATLIRKAREHIENFQFSVRGRRGQNPTELLNDNSWWALGQHHGLATPLLDWTDSPFVALYFAFQKTDRPNSGKRAVYALNAGFAIEDGLEDDEYLPQLNFIRPLSDDNARLVNQAGLFTRTELGTTIEECIRIRYEGETKKAPLLKLTMPNTDRDDCIRTLNRMNINHTTLFPDLYGSSQYCNMALTTSRY